MKAEVLGAMKEIFMSVIELERNDAETYWNKKKHEASAFSGAFLWYIMPHGSIFSDISDTKMKSYMIQEDSRMSMFRRHKHGEVHISGFPYLNSALKDTRGRIYFCDGNTLTRLESVEEMHAYYMAETREIMERYIQDYPRDYEMCDQPLEIKFDCVDTENDFHETELFAQRMDAPTFEACIDELENMERFSSSQHILISPTFYNHSYEYRVMVDGEEIYKGYIRKIQSNIPAYPHKWVLDY